MSEDLDLEANNLCIPEDAFEKFQAVSMYQEKEYIALPQSTPRKPKPPKAMENCLESSANEVVSSSGNVKISPVKRTQIGSLEKQPLNSSCVESSVGSKDSVKKPRRKTKTIKNYGNDTDMVVSNSENGKGQANNVLASPTSITSAVPRKRGRKAKKSEENVSIETPKTIQNPDISSTPFSSDPECSDTLLASRKKRGRPRKVGPSEEPNMIPMKTDKDLSSDLSSSDNKKNVHLPPKKPTRRGRPKGAGRKVPTDDNPEMQVQPPSLEDHNKEICKGKEQIRSEDLNSALNETTKKRKRSRGSSIANIEASKIDESKIQPDSMNKMPSDDDLDDVCLSKLKSVPSQSNMNMSTDDNCPMDSKPDNKTDNKPDETLKDVNPEIIDEQHKSRKRKGKQKKANSLTSPQPASAPDPEGMSANEVTHVEDSDADNLSLSKLKKINEDTSTNIEVTEVPVYDSKVSEQVAEPNENNITPTKRNTKMPVMADFEYNIDSVIGSDNTDAIKQDADDSLAVEDSSKRPTRRKTKAMKYDEGSDEDPFANVELSDDEPRRGRRGYKYYSDDEYIPGKRGHAAYDSTDTDTEISDKQEIISDDTKKQKKKKYRKRSDNQSPRKRGKKGEEYDLDDGDEETQLSQPSQKWGNTNEFENFLAKKIQGTNLKIKKVTSNVPTETSKIEIPVLNPEAKKTVEMCSQTSAIPTASVSVQTSTPNDIPLIENIPLTPEQSEKACYFLNSIVKTTAELGTLMTQKSEDFIKKKINTNHVVDTAKMDYCVKKSFLLFKLAKHNLLQMEEDLAKQYEEFLVTHDLTRCREEPKSVLPTPKESNSDSDCEIVDVKPSPNAKPLPNIKSSQNSPAKPAFNPKTVFLNKELSIKIAKKPSESKKLDIKGRHTVWINDTVMVKKVKPTQSFLAQDSRNKKPPDNNIITTKMVSDFFKDYYRQKALSACAPFVSTDWLNVSKECVCNYFVVKPIPFEKIHDGFSINSNASNTTVSEPAHSLSDVKILAKNTGVSSPEPLFKLCFRILNHHLHPDDFKEGTHKKRHDLADQKNNPVTLFRLCMRTITDCTRSKMEVCPEPAKHESSRNTIQELVPSLQVLCHRQIVELLEHSSYNPRGEKESYLDINCYSEESSDSWSNYSQEIVSLPEVKKNYIKSLSSLCIEMLNAYSEESSNYWPNKSQEIIPLSENNKNGIKSLLSLCVKKINFNPERSSDCCSTNSQEIIPCSENKKNGIKSLFSLCVEYIQRIHILENNNNSILLPKTLKSIAYENVKYLLYANDLYEIPQPDGETAVESLMINCVNTLSEEAFLNLEQCNTDIPDSSEYLDDFDDNEDSFDAEQPDVPSADEDQTEPSWVTQVQMQELRSCVNINSLDGNSQQELEPIITQIKLEPLDDITDNLLDSTQVKTEPGPGPDEMTIIPDVKPEIEDNLHAAPIHSQDSNSNSYDEDAFEQFVSGNKLMRAFADQGITGSIYSQSSERIRKQYEPDYYEENNADMLGLLVPHTYETMNIQTAKGSLMESSSDEGNKKGINAAKKATAKRRGRPKKTEQKPNNKEIPVLAPVVTKEKEKSTSNEVAILTRKMKERIRQEEKRNQSSDSEEEIITVRLRSREKKDNFEQTRDKSKTSSKEAIDQAKDKAKTVAKETIDHAKDKSKVASKQPNDLVHDKPKLETKGTIEQVPEKPKPGPKSHKAYQTRDKSKLAVQEDTKEIQETSVSTSSSKIKNDEIQCNNVDSTDQLEDSAETFTGFTSIETNEMSNYEKYMKFVYEKVIPDKEDDSKDNKKVVIKNPNIDTPVICSNEPIELLECEPTMPFFDQSVDNVKPPRKNKVKAVNPDKLRPYTDRHGWQCYPINLEDSKLCQDSFVHLEKLPESFVQTYFQYQNIATSRDDSDEEINRLTNLNTLNRATIVKPTDKKYKSSSKREAKDDKSENVPDDDSRTVSAAESDHYDELMPSDDEGPNIENEVPPPVERQTENTLAKNSLMEDKESDDEALIKIKKEPEDSPKSTENKKPRPLSKKKAAVDVEESSDLMLTADKMMNKELTLLHAPVVMDEQVKETPSKGPATRHNKKSGTKTSPTATKVKAEEDSSSEEEKQWVSTKEKLLKRMGKKETATADDAKRAKLVIEFIERREGNPDGRKRRAVSKPRRSGKRFLEREKQLRVLQRELFGETSNDPTVSKRSVAAWKGRRNIRKVLDKKSLARSTVIANMEEFERKKRLNARQTKLRELLGCEEGVNVLVINDEVCLEYDFEEHRPVVTIHPFFTKVMKAHQYEGVKFMWDACFESLADIEAGHAGGGCILAHCMGLGKTLQVLALLHTVLTHPRVGMQRVLVCCPLSTVLNWVDEIHKWIGPVTNQIKVFELSKLKKTYERAYQLEDWYNGGGIFIIGYELFRSLSTLDPLLDEIRPTIINKIRTALLDPGPDIIVCDEGHLLKNDCSVLAVAMSRVVTKRRIVLTGTPMQNNLREYYCMVNFVKPNLLGTYSEYSNRFENPIMNGQHRDSSEEDIKLMKARTHILHKVLEGCLQRQEASVLYPYLPKKHEYTVFITLTKCQWDLYKHYLNHYSRQMKQNSILKDFHILQKIWSHPQVLHNFQTKAQENRNKIKLEKIEDDLATEDQEDIKDGVATELWWLQYLDGGAMLDALDSSNKFVVVFRILDECVALGDKVLIFSTSLFCLDALEYFLKKINKWSLGQEYYRLDGSVPAEVRQKWCREFNAENNLNTKLFLVSTRAGCLGLNMTAANRVIIMDTSWNPAHDIQSIFRVYRFGQKKDCYIYRLVAMGTMEQKIYERSVTKQAVACRVVDEQQIDRHYNMAELTELYRYDEAGASVAGGVAVGVCDVALLRVARETALHAVHEHDSLLRSSEQGLPEHERAAAWMQFQQEQAHKQMENKLIANIPKLSLKRMQGNAYTKSLHLEDIKPEIKQEEDTNEDFVPPPESKPKRGRRPKAAANKEHRTSTPKPTPERFNPDVPGTSANTNYGPDKKHYAEEMMVQKITEILIEHDFHNKKGTAEISSLVNKVRKIVKQGYIFKNDESDEVTTSIAKVLLQKQMSLPVLTDIMCESINKSASPNTTSKEPENILSTPTPENTVKETTTDTRRKRKAALAAEKHIDSISQDVIISLDEDLDSSDTEFIPKIVEKAEKSNKRKSLKEATKTTTRAAAPETKKEINILPTSNDAEVTVETPISNTKPISRSRPGPKAFKEKVQQKYKELTQKIASPTEDKPGSILLSDDEEESNNTPATSSVEPAISITPANQPEDDEVVPLPLSLLTNQNFINIVAHTYLKGNPMLDADAATLAAQYSTFKSLKEAEQTGKPIVSGPIYDIAARVVGKSLFKKMNTNEFATAPSPVETANVTIELKQRMDNATDKKPMAETKTKKRVEKKTNSSSNVTETTTNTGNVIPVGLIKMAASLPSEEFATESILPDDDDDTHIVPHDMPTRTHTQNTPTPAPPPATPAPVPTIPPNYLMPKNNIAEIPSTSAKPPSKQVIKINKGKIIHPNAVTSGNSMQAKSQPTTQHISPNDDTICLDSDDDTICLDSETITPPATPTAVPVTSLPNNVMPVSVTAGHTSEIPLAAPLSTAQPLAPGAPHKQLILRQVAAGAAPKFVIVPANNPSLGQALPEHLKKLPTLVPKEPTVSTEAILPIETSIATTNKIKQARCRPGDILKISDKGEIEVLKVAKLSTATKSPQSEVVMTIPTSETVKLSSQVDKPISTTTAVTKPKTSETVKPSSQVDKPVSTTTAVTKPKTVYARAKLNTALETQSKPAVDAKTKPVIEVIKATPVNEPAKTKQSLSTATKPSSNSVSQNLPANKSSGPSNVTVAESRTAKLRSVSISSSSSEGSRPASPDAKPLSISRNVVHIQAADEKAGISSDNAKPKQKTTKPAIEVTTTTPVNEPAKNKQSLSTATKPSSSNSVSQNLPANKSSGPSNVTVAESRTAKLRSVSISSSSSEGSRPASPDTNPLSILKNVVHIQAADEKAGTSIDNAKPKQKPSNCAYIEHTYSSDHKGAAAKQTNKDSGLKSTKEPVKIVKDTSKPKVIGSVTITGSGSVKADASNKMLTDLLNRKTSLSMKPLEKKAGPSTEKKPVSLGGLKAIVVDNKSLSSNNKTFKTVDLTQITNVMSGSGATILKTKIEAKKRVSTTDTSTPKRKKTTPMTLKDFNIDDIDDIIELD